MNPNLEFVQKFSLAYSAMCKPLCRELGLPQTAFDILMFLANNPAYQTASDIVEVRHIKANLVSVNVDRLVKEGYLMRQAVEHDRRKTKLLCTPQAKPVIAQGKRLQQSFFEELFGDIDEEMRETFFSTLRLIEENLDRMLKEAK